jgi:Transglutaminase-like superfamily
LSWAEWGLLLEAGVWLALVRLALLRVPLKRLAPILARPMTASTYSVEAGTQQMAQRLGWAVRIMSRYMPWDSRCLAQALTVTRMLGRRGIASTLYLGTTRDEANQLQMHAWVRCGSVVLTGGPQSPQIYTVIATFA